MQIPRSYQSLQDYLEPKKVLVLYGPRQVGKTTLIRELESVFKGKSHFATGDNLELAALFESEDFEKILEYGKGYDLLIIDEAQRLPKVGQCLKILADYSSQPLSIVVTGSSSFELAGQIGEPLTGRKRTLILYPISQHELLTQMNAYQVRQGLEEYLIYGSYPRVITASSNVEKQRILEEITLSYLFKDVLELDAIKNSKVLLDLLKLIALQIGQEVSLSELGQQLSLDRKTVARYLDILEKAFVLFELRGYSGNLRNEISRKSKYYFFDVGVRNALISNFNPADSRNDFGQLWENFVIVERLKFRQYTGLSSGMYFWRTYEQQEVDLVEQREGRLFGYECKWSDKKGKKSKPPKLWLQTYKESTYEVITPENYLDFVGAVKS
ncbi:MAG: ATP-binding protein [Patescibacteria group bacterium]